MSWLVKGAISKARESGEALKQSQTLKSLQEKTSSASRAAGGKLANVALNVASKTLRRKSVMTAEELTTQLETQAGTTRSPEEFAELHRSWTTQMTGKDSYGIEERDATFKEVLLGSRAIELSLEVIASDAALRNAYAEPPKAGDTVSPIACLHLLLWKCLACPVSVWSELLRAALKESGCENCASWLAAAVTSLKCDAQEEALCSERRALALRAECLQEEIKTEVEDERRVVLSRELLQACKSVRQVFDEEQALRARLAQTRARDLTLLVAQVQGQMAGMQSKTQLNAGKRELMEDALKQSQESTQTQLQSVGDARVGIDQELAQLEERKRAMRIEVDESSKGLDEARSKQREHMASVDRHRAELDGIRKGLKVKLETQSAALAKAKLEEAALQRAEALTQEAGVMVQSTLGNQLELLKQKLQAPTTEEALCVAPSLDLSVPQLPAQHSTTPNQQPAFDAGYPSAAAAAAVVAAQATSLEPGVTSMSCAQAQESPPSVAQYPLSTTVTSSPEPVLIDNSRGETPLPQSAPAAPKAFV